MRRTLATGLVIAVLGIAACNLQVSTAPEPTPFATPAPFTEDENVQINFVTATPLGALPLAASPEPGDLSAPDPATTPSGGNIADWFVNNVVIPVWNFLYTFVIQALVSTWDFAGERGGFVAQILCCIIPFILGIIFLARYIISGRRRLIG